MTHQFFSRNGSILPVEQATVPLSDIAYSYGFGVYETIRVSGGLVYFLPEHTARLLASAQAIELEHEFSAEFVAEAVHSLVASNQADACNVKILLIGGRTSGEAQLLVQTLNPHFPDRKLYTEGAHCITEHYIRRYPEAKTLNMLPSYLAYRRAQQAGAYDALLIDHEGCIREGTRTNFFVLQGKTLISPPDSKILPGVMRQVVLKVAASNGYVFQQRDIPFDNLGNYDAAFLTSSSSKIMPIRSIDALQFGERPEALIELMRLSDDFLANCHGNMG